MDRKIFAMLLSLCLTVCLLPTTVFASEEQQGNPVSMNSNIASGGEIQLGMDGVVKGNKVYFGQYTESGTTYNMPWIVLNNNGFLLSEYTIGTSKFRNSEDPGYYNYSTVSSLESASILKTTMEGLYNGEGTKLFTGLEQGAIKETQLAGNSIYSRMADVNAYLFPLSSSELSGLDSATLKAKSISVNSLKTGWALRTSRSDIMVYHVDASGSRRMFPNDDALGVRPACNLNSNSVLFTSAAEDGKSSADVLNIVSATIPETGWKLTLKDSTRDFEAATTAYDSTNKILTIAYSGAEVGNNEYISAMVQDSSGNISHYGHLLQPENANGTIDVDLSDVIMAATDTLYVFSEQCNGNYLTDYASALVAVPLNKNAYIISNDLTDIASSNTLNYHLMSDINDYTTILTVADDYILPKSVTVRLDGTTLEEGESTYSYDNETGTLTIKAATITGDIIISAVGVAKTHTGIITPNGNLFESKTVGYGSIVPEVFTIESTGTGALDNLAVSLVGTNATNFMLDTTNTLTSLDASDGMTTITTFTVKPNDNMSVGTYTASIQVNADNMEEINKAVSFTVSAPKDDNPTINEGHKKNTLPKESGKDSISSKTGDNNNLILWLAFLIISGGVLIVIGNLKKRKKYSNK